MKKTLLSFFYFFLILIGVSFSAEYKPNPAKECAICHYEWMPEFLEGKGTNIVAPIKTRVVADERMCFSCHNGTVADSRIRIWSGDIHKLTNKIPKNMTIPKELPLDNGKISCKTCHSAHSTGDPKKEGVEKSIFLRMDNSNGELCMSCHRNYKTELSHPLSTIKENLNEVKNSLRQVGGKLGTKNNVNCMSCHIPHSPAEKKLLIYYIDDSKLCSICHKDKIDDRFQYKVGMLNHPINIKHESIEEVKNILKKQGIYGKNNEMICLTCHSPHKSRYRKLLIENNSTSELCFECHKNKKEIFDSKHDLRKVKDFKTKDDKTITEKGVCGACHDPHGWSLELPYKDKDTDLITKGCMSCHANEKYVKKTFNLDKFSHPVGKEVKDFDDKEKKLILFDEVKKFFSEYKKGVKEKKIITCATCHDVHSKNQMSLRLDAKSGKLCISCHKDKSLLEKTDHGYKKLEKGCLSCHKIHDSDNKRLLVKDENDGCLDCHKADGLASKTQISIKNSHPYDMLPKMKIDEKLFKLKDGKIACITCHDPHLNSKPKMGKDFLRSGNRSKEQFCISCHTKQEAVVGTSHDLKDDNKKTYCDSCHSAHNAKSEKGILSLSYNYKDDNDLCLSCHREDGIGKKKVVSSGHIMGEIKKISEQKIDKSLLSKFGDKNLIQCKTCHDPHTNGPKKGIEGTFENSFIREELVLKNKNICYSCHKDKNDFVESKHNPKLFEQKDDSIFTLIKTNNLCGACHNTHNTSSLLLRKEYEKDLDKLCVDCHSYKGYGKNKTISSSHRMDKDIKDKHKYLTVDGKFSCITCHDSHSKNKGMIRYYSKESQTTKNICIDCHNDKKYVSDTKHDLNKLGYLSSRIKEFKYTENSCYFCHQPHNYAKDTNLMFPFTKSNISFSYQICLSCHSKEQYGFKKLVDVYDHDKIFKIFPFKEQYKEFLYDDNNKHSPDGSITCSTCHDPHKWDETGSKPLTLDEDGNNKNSFLKISVKEKFCKVCHGDKAGELFDKFHDINFRKSRDKKGSEREILFRLLIMKKEFESKGKK